MTRSLDRSFGAVRAGAGGFGADDGGCRTRWSVGVEPMRAGTVAAHGGVMAMGYAGQAFDDGFGAFPEVDAFQDRINQIGDRAIVGVLGVGVM